MNAIGLICAAGAGAAQPLMSLLFGRLTQNFVEFGTVLNMANAGDPDAEPPEDGGYVPVLDIDLNVHTNLVATAISDDGKWIAVSDWYESRLFRIETEVSSLFVLSGGVAQHDTT